jgi:hypothetical protein
LKAGLLKVKMTCKKPRKKLLKIKKISWKCWALNSWLRRRLWSLRCKLNKSKLFLKPKEESEKTKLLLFQILQTTWMTCAVKKLEMSRKPWDKAVILNLKSSATTKIETSRNCKKRLRRNGKQPKKLNSRSKKQNWTQNTCKHNRN